MLRMPYAPLVLLLAVAATASNAADYPNHPVRLVVPFAPGGGADTLARIVGQSLSERLSQPVVIDNRGGAGGVVGTELVARASPDGYTLLLGTQSTHGTNPSLYKKLPYDPVGGFAPVTLLASVPNVLVVNPSVAASSVKELIALAKRTPGGLNYASVGVGSSQQLVAELFKSRAGIDMVHVPYKGTAPALNDLISGQVQVMFTNLITSAPHIRSGRLRGLAVTSSKRSSVAPELPTLAEVLPKFEASSWYALLAPAKTPGTGYCSLEPARDIDPVHRADSVASRGSRSRAGRRYARGLGRVHTRRNSQVCRSSKAGEHST